MTVNSVLPFACHAQPFHPSRMALQFPQFFLYDILSRKDQKIGSAISLNHHPMMLKEMRNVMPKAGGCAETEA